MNPNNAIEVKDVRKFFKVYYDKGHMLRERVIHLGRNKYERREVLKGISFNVRKGESVGLIGKNGCGKSTTLKLLTRILRPNGGEINIQGRVCSLIELGAGFHPDMSGRENIYINASIFGIKAKEVDRRLNDIIRFSELEDYIDNPVRTYSSGMYMRLAFSVAINVDADILLIDEILAVGDNSFQTKCFNKLKSLKDAGTTIVIVSHALGQIEKLCDRAIWIDEGVIREEGSARQICKKYLDVMEEARLERAEKEYQMQLEEEKKKRALEEEENKKKKEEAEKKQKEEEKQRKEELERQIKKQEEERIKNASCRNIAPQCSPDARRTGNGKIRFTEVLMVDKDGYKCTSFELGDSMTIRMKYESDIPGKPVNVVIGITRNDWIYCYGTSFQHVNGNFIVTQKNGEISITIQQLRLLQGKYTLETRLQDEEKNPYDYLNSIIDFEIVCKKKKEAGIFSMPYEWKTDDAQKQIGIIK